jgi:hypothetical protein
MPCAITSGYTIDCRDAMGGLKEIYIANYNDINTTALAASGVVSGVVTGITKLTGKKFYKFQQLAQASQASETITGSDENGSVFFAQSVEMFLLKMQAATRNQVLLLAQGRVIVVTVDRNGKSFLYGLEIGLTLNTGDGNSGKAFGDRNGYVLTFTGAEREPAPEVNAATVAALETAG